MSRTHPSLCPIYCPFPCQWAWEPSWSDWRGRNSAQILPLSPKEWWYVPVIQVHGFLWRRVPLSSCWVGGTGRPQGQEPSLCEAADHKSRAASVKTSALRTTGNKAVNGQDTSRLWGGHGRAEPAVGRACPQQHATTFNPTVCRCFSNKQTAEDVPSPDFYQH